jgi:lysozyme
MRSVNAKERDAALAWVDKNIHVKLTEPQKAGIASFCPYNIGPVNVSLHVLPAHQCW